MKENAPEPAPIDSSAYTQKQEQNFSPMSTTNFNVDKVEETYRKNFGYDMMNEEEKAIFEEKLRKQRKNKRKKHSQEEWEETEKEKTKEEIEEVEHHRIIHM